MTNFEQRMREHQEHFQQNVDQINQKFNRDVKRILFIGAAAIVVLNVAFGILSWLLIVEGK